MITTFFIGLGAYVALFIVVLLCMIVCSLFCALIVASIEQLNQKDSLTSLLLGALGLAFSIVCVYQFGLLVQYAIHYLAQL